MQQSFRQIAVMNGNDGALLCHRILKNEVRAALALLHETAAFEKTNDVLGGRH